MLEIKFDATFEEEAALEAWYEENGVGDVEVYDEDSRDDEAGEQIRNSLWKFRPGFLANETGMAVEMFNVLQERAEDANDWIEDILDATCGLDDFIDSAIQADGYGPFLSSYDGEEIEIEIDGNTYYGYRI